jgi:hypothetical protein
MKKKAPATTSRSSKKAVTDLTPRNTGSLKGGAKSTVESTANKTKDAIIQNLRG